MKCKSNVNNEGSSGGKLKITGDLAAAVKPTIWYPDLITLIKLN